MHQYLRQDITIPRAVLQDDRLSSDDRILLSYVIHYDCLFNTPGGTGSIIGLSVEEVERSLERLIGLGLVREINPLPDSNRLTCRRIATPDYNEFLFEYTGENI